MVDSRNILIGGLGVRHAPQDVQICNKVGQKATMPQESWQQYIL